MNHAGTLIGSMLWLGQTTTDHLPPDQDLLAWAVILIGVAAVLFFVEVVVPSGGVIGVLSAVSLTAGIVMLFRINTTTGLIGAIVSLAAIPFLFVFALKLWPSTPIARMLRLGSPPRRDMDNTQPPHDDPLLDLVVGASGHALTDLRPVGTCLINNRRLECLASNGLIRRGSEVRVVSVDGMEIKVRTEQAAT